MEIIRRGGNVGLKLDITQAYDSLSWDFLFQAMSTFGFSAQFIHWLKERKLIPMVNINGCQPTHIFFADDIFLFCNGDKRNIDKLPKLLKDYQQSSGQIVSMEKSKYFVGGTTDNRRNQIANLCGMTLSKFPYKYLGVNLVPGKIKSAHVWECVDLLQSKMPGWMGKMLSFQERLILVKHVLCSISIYNMSIYKWPRKVLLECDRIIRNFLWSGDPSKEKLLTVKWEEVNAPLA
ncbi:uncharacterized protein LOC113360493 [Papaver somniferum]|uniref:uncharacterized protein LOC113360493 n=1 Tax=Papaver somniferum TaxID=3469 RepID=UPI000E6FEA8B|nr:uncharacterized protein LOC113360493 [Papaver somniferum]